MRQKIGPRAKDGGREWCNARRDVVRRWILERSGREPKVFKRLLALLGERVGKSSRAVLAAVAGLDLLGATLCQAIEDVAFFWRGRWRLSQSIGTAQRVMLLLAYGGLHSNGNKLGHQRPQRSAGNARKDEGDGTLSGCQAACPDHAGGIGCLSHLSSLFHIKTYQLGEDRIGRSERARREAQVAKSQKSLQSNMKEQPRSYPVNQHLAGGKDDDESPPVKQRQYRCMDRVDPESLGYVNTRMAAYPAGEDGCFVVAYHFVSDARLGVGARSG